MLDNYSKSTHAVQSRINGKKVYQKWTADKVVDIAKKYSSIKDFREKEKLAYSSYIRSYPGLLDDVFPNKKKANNYWSVNKIIEKSAEYKNKTDFRNGCGSAYNAAKNHKGLLDTLYENKIIHWDRNKIKRVLSKYTDRTLFMRENFSAYVWCLNNDKVFLNELLPSKFKRWGLEEIIEESKKYKTKTEFQRGSPAANSALLKRFPGVIDTIFVNASKYNDRDAVYIWHADRDIYKIGLTSFCLNDIRIKQVSKKGCFNNIKILRLSKVLDSKKLEKELLKFGKPVEFDSHFDGHTEFRHLTEYELGCVLSLFDKNVCK